MLNKRIKAPAKLNLALDLQDLRADGYHNLQSLMVNLSLHDELYLSAESSEHCKGETLHYQVEDSRRKEEEFTFGFGFAQDENLTAHQPMPDISLEAWSVVKVMKTYFAALVKHDLKAKFPYNWLTLTRSIPAGSGLGGASSDAAALIKVLVEAQAELQDELEDSLARLGADIPFSYLGQPALVTGLGDRLKPLDNSLEGISVLLVKPNFAVSTAQAFARYDAAIAKGQSFPTTKWNSLLESYEARDLAAMRSSARNTFIELLDPSESCVIRDLIHKLYEEGAEYANMTGSGTCCFALFTDAENRDAVYRAFEHKRGAGYWLCKSAIR